MSKKRYPVAKTTSKKLFTKTADRVNPKNGLGSIPARGGIRL